MLSFCKCQGKLIYHLKVEIQVAVGFVVYVRMLQKKTLKKANKELHAAEDAVYGRSLPWKEIISLVLVLQTAIK